LIITSSATTYAQAKPATRPPIFATRLKASGLSSISWRKLASVHGVGNDARSMTRISGRSTSVIGSMEIASPLTGA
jgi:hypothetical protein